MPVTAVYAPNASTGNGVTTVFPYDFSIIDQSHILVTVDGVEQTLGVDYTVDGVGDPGGGNVTFSVAPASATEVVRAREVPYIRSTDYQANGSFREDTVDNDFDLLQMQIQQVESRALALDKSAGIAGLIPGTETATGRANRVIGFDDSGDVALLNLISGELVVGPNLSVEQDLTVGGVVFADIIDSNSTGSIFFRTNGAQVQVEIPHQVGTANWLKIRGNLTGQPALVTVEGETNIGLTLSTKGSGDLRLDPNSGDIRWQKAMVALGGGGGATLGTVGGSGPAATAQRGWLRLLESDGTASWLPLFR